MLLHDPAVVQDLISRSIESCYDAPWFDGLLDQRSSLLFESDAVVIVLEDRYDQQRITTTWYMFHRCFAWVIIEHDVIDAGEMSMYSPQGVALGPMD